MDLLVQDRSSKEVNDILSAVKAGLLEACVSTQSLLDAYYSTLKYKVPFSTFSAIYKELRKYVNFASVDSLELDWAIDNFSGDLEHDAQFTCAYDNCCDYFITRDRNFLNRPNSTPMTLISPESFVSQMR